MEKGKKAKEITAKKDGSKEERNGGQKERGSRTEEERSCW